nr:MAG TPA: hypothetical protein [Caudoviricetes sp.]
MINLLEVSVFYYPLRDRESPLSVPLHISGIRKCDSNAPRC